MDYLTKDFITAYNQGLPIKQLGISFFNNLPNDKMEQATLGFIKELISVGLIRPRAERTLPLGAENNQEDFSKIVETFQKGIGRRVELSERDPRLSMSGEINWVILGDLHIPYCRWDEVERICRRYEGSRLVLAGDLFSFEHFSVKYATNTPRPSPIDILKEGTAGMEAILPWFEEVIVILGNHDKRLPRLLQTKLGGDWYDVGLYLYESMFAPFPNVHVLKAVIDQGDICTMMPLDGYVRIGDLAVTHLEFSGKPLLTSAKKTAEYLADQLPSEWNKIKVITQGHSHKTSYGRVLGRHLYECGSLSYVEPYIWENHRTASPVQNGYVTVTQVNGETVEHNLTTLESQPIQVHYSSPLQSIR